MLIEERFQEILEIVNEQKTVSVQELTERLGTSESTVRRDLTQLHKLGKLVKIHGGAMAPEIQYATKDMDMAEKYQLHMEEKRQIAQYAASLIEPDDFVYIDAGTTTELMTEYVSQREASYVTNSLAHARILAQKGLRTFILGGEVKGVTEAIVGADALDTIRRYHFTKGFFGANGVKIREGFTTPEANEAAVKRLAMAHTKDCYVLCDGSKFNQISQVTFAGFEDAVILTCGLNDPQYRKYENVMEVEQA